MALVTLTALLLLVLPVACAADGPARAESKEPVEPAPAELRPPAPADELSSAFQDVARAIAPSVVSISSIRRIEAAAREVPSPFGGDPFERFFGPRQRGRDRIQQGQGTGVMVSSEGHILTNNHVVHDADQVTVRLADDREFTAEVVGTDAMTDLAVLRIEGDGFQPAILGDSEQLTVGQWVVAVGDPFGLSSTITAGIVSATGRSRVGLADYEDFVQTDAAINPGNSGGPLVNLRGEVVGINTAIASRTGGSMGIGFAIPSSMARTVMHSLIEDGRVTRGWLGVVVQDLDERLAESFDYDSTDGVLISEVSKGGPAENAGLRSGDIITSLAGEPVEDVDDLRFRIAAMQPDTDTELGIYRDGDRESLSVTLGELEAAESEAEPAAAPADELGMTVRTLTADLARQLGYEGGLDGILVTGVDPFGPAAAAGIRARDIIVRVQGTPVGTVSELRSELARHDLERGVRMTVVSNGAQRFVVLKRAG